MNEVTPISWRRRFSILLMAAFVLVTPLGAGIAFGVGIGLVVLGITAGIASFIIGAE